MTDIRQRITTFFSKQPPSYKPHRVTLYTKDGCHLCEDVRAVLSRVRSDLPFDYEEIDITSDKTLFERYKEKIPVVAIDGVERFRCRVNERRLKRVLAE